MRTSLLGWTLLLASLPARATEWLQPIQPYTDPYHRAVFDALVRDKHAKAWMISRPSFSVEFAVVLTERPLPKNTKPGTVPGYQLRWTAARGTSIWQRYAPAYGVNGPRKGVPVAPIAIDENRVELPGDVGELIIEAWTRVLNETRYPRSWGGGLDGTTYEFYVAPSLSGTTWSPQAGPTRMMVDLGEAMAAYARDHPSARAYWFKRILELSEALKAVQTD